MVDFQARDTRRAPTTSEEDKEATVAGEDTAEESGGSPNESDGPSLSVAVISVDTDEAVTERIVSTFQSSDHSIATRERVSERDDIQSAVETAAADGVDVVVTAGSIGVAPDEETIEAVQPLFKKELPGFGEAFRQILYEYIGSGIVTVRSTAGVVDRSLVFCLPGHADAAQLAIKRLIVTQSPKLAEQLR
jgi:molybdenum cofactor biosynthesis protein B